ALLVHALDEAAQVADPAVGRRALDQGSEEGRLEIEAVRVPDYHPPAERLRPRAHYLDGLRMAVVGDEERLRAGPGHGVHQAHRLRSRGPLVEERGVRDRQAGEIDDHRLEV